MRLHAPDYAYPTELTLNTEKVKATISQALARDTAFLFEALQECDTQEQCLEAMTDILSDIELPIENIEGEHYSETLGIKEWQESIAPYSDFIVISDLEPSELIEWSVLELTRLANSYAVCKECRNELLYR